MNRKWKRPATTVLGVIGALALSVPPAEARDGRNAAIGFGIAAGALAFSAAAASRPYYDSYYDGPYAYAVPYRGPPVYDSYTSDNVPNVHNGARFWYGGAPRYGAD